MAVGNNVTDSPALQKPSQLPILNRIGRAQRKATRATFAILNHNMSLHK